MRFEKTRLKKVTFAIILIGFSFFLTLRHRQIEDRGTLAWFDRPVIFLTAPIAGAFTAVRQKVRSIVDRYLFLVGVERENESLKRGIEEYSLKEALFRETEDENRRLREIADLQNQLSGKGIAARVISFPATGPYRLLTIDKGSEDGVRLRSPVIAPSGLVGQVSRLNAGTSQVLLIVDPTSAVDARFRDSQERGLIVGKVLKLGLKRETFMSAFEYLSRAAEVPEGTAVITSGLDGIYPPGITIGHVYGSRRKKYDIFQEAEVMPAVDFFKLKEILILP